MNPVRPFPIIAIGASDGGFEALERFLSALPSDSDFAITFMQHLPPERQGSVADWHRLKKFGFEIVDVSDGTKIGPGRIYLCPPARDTSVEKGVFRISDREDGHFHLPIDEFFTSLAEDMGERAIAVVFSGAGSDGARGSQMVRAAGGTVFVQDPASAEIGEMPLAAISTGQMDGVLPPEEIAREIVKLRDSGMDAASPDEVLTGEGLDGFCRLLFEKTGYRFNNYKQSVLGRRIRRRMYLHGISSPARYLEMVATKESEPGLLASDLMIGVTSFFRDHLAWKALHLEVTRKLVAQDGDSPIRVWCAACATGEEAYSIAMLLRHELDRASRKREVLVFATDVNDQALDKAREGVYPATISADVPAEYMEKFFESGDNVVSVSKEIRQNVVFARQDLLTDPPFSRIDLVICRNLLIYLEPEAQEKCIALFHYALKKGGYLFLGGAESPGRDSGLFITLPHKKCRVFQKAETVVSSKTALSIPFAPDRFSIAPIQQGVPEQRQSTGRFVHEALLEEFAPAAVAVNPEYTILYHSGPTHRYLRHPRGVTTASLLDLLPETVKNRVRDAMCRAGVEKKAFSVPATIPMDSGRKKRVTLRISKLREGLFLILFKEGAAKAGEGTLEVVPSDETTVHQLENELSATRDELQRHIEQLRSLNEELQSSNEEFQAANEELETSREELQSLNEELTTVNNQLQTKIEEEEAANNDLSNFIQSTAIPTIFLDEGFRVRRFTPAMAKLIKLIPTDVGRPITDMSHGRLGPDLLEDARTVLEDLAPVRREFGTDASWHVRTVLPYRTSDNRIEGVVVTYTDITEIRAAEERSRHLASFPLLNPNPVLEVDPSGRVVFMNPASSEVLESCGIDRENGAALLPLDFGAILKGWDRTTEVNFDRDVPVGDRIFNIATQLVPQFGVARIYARDITKRKKAEGALLESEQRVRLKLSTILSPEGDLGDLDLADILDVGAIQSLMDDFHELVRIPMAVIDLNGTVLVGEGWQDICTKFHRAHPDTCRHCVESDVLLSAGIPGGESRLYKCRNNMWDIATPIMIGGKHMGNVFSGQFFFEGEHVDRDLFREQARLYGFDEDDYLAALDAVPRMSKETVDRAMSFFAGLANTFSQLSYSNIKLARWVSQGEALTASLQESEERLKMAQAMAHVGGWDLDLASGRLSWSDEIYRILGFEPQEFVPTYQAFLDAVHPDDREAVEAAYASSLREEKETYEIEHRVVRKHAGEVRIVRQKSEHFRDETGRVVRSVGVVHDITELKSRENKIAGLSRLYAVLSRVNEAIVRIGDEASLYGEVCRIVSEIGGFPLVWVGRVEEKRVLPSVHCGRATGYLKEIKVEIEGELSMGPTGTCVRENRPVINDDFEANPATAPWQEAARRYGFRASAAFPLRRAGVPVAAFTIYSTEPGVFDPDQVALLESLSADLSYALDAIDAEQERTRTVRRLAAAKKEWERTFDSVPDMIAIVDANHRIVQVNAAMAIRLGVDPDECVGLHCYEAIHGTSEPPDFCPHSRTMKDCLQHVEEVHEEKFGGDFEVTTSPIYDDLGEMVGSVHVVHEITTRKRAERERELALQFLSIANQSTSKEELIRDAVAFFQEQSGCAAVGIRLREGDDYPYFETRGFPGEFVLAETSLCTRDADGQPVLNGAGYPIMECMCGNVIQGRFDPSKPFFTPLGSFWSNCTTELLATSTEEDRQARTRNRCNGEGFESVALIALRIGRQTLGLLQLNDRRENRFSAEAIALWERLAGYLAIALAKVEAEEALRCAHDELEERVRERTDELEQAYNRLIEEGRVRQQVEGQLRQAQKMDALGTLTGGIAHDFNNILAAILGFTDVVRGHLSAESRDARSLDRVMDAGIRGRDLIKQMLAFSRKSDLVKKPLLVSSIVRETMKLLRASIPTTITIEVDVEDNEGMILGDPVQIQQVIMNLSTNAAYSMRENGGQLNVELRGFTATESNPDGLIAGDYVRLTVRDTGEGIAEDDIEKIFDPFFTTKKQGEGTGLGLSVVHGIVNQLEGRIVVESRPGEGSVFSVFFPRLAAKAPKGSAGDEVVPTGHERVLFVDDEESLVELGREILEELGYRVVAHTSSRAALARFRLDPTQFDVIITDQTMPEMTGVELARESLALRPDIPVILCTGFSYQVDSEAAARAGIKAFAMKPLTKRELAKIMRQVLDG